MTSMDTILDTPSPVFRKGSLMLATLVAGIGFAGFIFFLTTDHPEQAWLAYLVNFMFFTTLSAGGLLFSTIMHFTKARWSPLLAGIAEAFSAFFPLSFILFLLLFAGYGHVFTWLGEDLHGKETWLNLPFLFTRDTIAFLILYSLGFAYIYHALQIRLKRSTGSGWIRQTLIRHFENRALSRDQIRKRMTLFAGWYIFAFAITLSLTGFDLVMSMDPHWYSTLFGAYTFIKGIYSGFGALILLITIMHLTPAIPFRLTESQLGDMSTLYFGFCIVWGDFFYSQFVVIWYGNIPEETSYIIERTMIAPWNKLAWTVFLICFIIPFIILLSRKIKRSAHFMAVISGCTLVGLWVEHFLLLGPSYLGHETHGLPLGIRELIISAGFLSLVVLAVLFYIQQFPELLKPDPERTVQWK